MDSLTPIDPELLFGQFECADFPVWLLDSQLDVVEANRYALAIYPAYCLTDGLRVFLSPQDADEALGAIREGRSLSIHPSILSRADIALTLTSWRSPAGERGALAFLAPAPHDSDPAVEALRQSLGSVGNLVITQGLRRCVSELFYSLSACSAKLREAGVALGDEQLQQMNRSCYQLLRATGNLEEKIQLSGQLSSPPKMVDFWSCCADLLDACQLLFRNNKLNFSYSLPGSTVYLDCDFGRIADALLHLISNAYLYGGSKVHLSIVGRDLNDRVLLTVSDNGPGLPIRITERLFQPFCSWDSLERDTTGMGLGLHLVRGIVTQAGGKVTVNTGDTGTAVAISLPLADQPPQGPAELGSSSADYLQDRFSPLYLALCDVIRVPEL